MKNLYKIQDELYIIDNNEKVTQNGIWAKCSFTGDILKNRNGQYAHKVILTTNKLLIKDGVQAIPDEFLEWFVKNPSCEKVEVKLIIESLPFPNLKYSYKIIIPKEQVLLQSSIDGEVIWKDKPEDENCVYVGNTNVLQQSDSCKKCGKQMWQHKTSVPINYSEEDVIAFAEYCVELQYNSFKTGEDVEVESMEELLIEFLKQKR